jgi:hypothetical protein
VRLGEVEIRAVEPRSVKALKARDRQAVSDLVSVTGAIHDAQRKQVVAVRSLRSAGVSWGAIGWAVGTTGEAARQRWGAR